MVSAEPDAEVPAGSVRVVGGVDQVVDQPVLGLAGGEGVDSVLAADRGASSLGRISRAEQVPAAGRPRRARDPGR